MINNKQELLTYFTVLNEIGSNIYTKNLNGEYTFANKMVLDLFNLSLDEFMGKKDIDLFKAEDAQNIIEMDKRVFAGEIIECEEEIALKNSNEKRYFLVEKKPLYDEGKIIGMFGISTDISKQKELENKILEQKKLLNAILDNVNALIYIKDDTRVLRYVNKNVANLFKIDVDQVLDKKDSEVLPQELADSLWEADKIVLETNEKVIKEERYEDEEGEKFYWTVKVPFKLENNQKGILGVSTDITLLKKQENDLKEKDKILNHQAKIAAMGEMMENIAHQWRQPLSLISTIASGIKIKKEYDQLDETLMIEELDTITDSVNYLSDTIDYFRGYLINNNQKEKFYIKDTIDKTLNLVFKDLQNQDINIISKIEQIELVASQNDFIQVLINLITNAKDAFKEKQIKDKAIFLNTYREENEIIIEVIDNAGGLKIEVIDRVFEPYFTTKYKTQGTGIGLFMCQQIIHDNFLGSIKVSNEEINYKKQSYQGAFFKIKIPLIKI